MSTKKVVYMGIFIALALVLPIGFHYLGTNLGPVFLPMHLPVFLAGIVLGPIGGMIVGGLAPLISTFLTGMPPLLPILPIMFIELMCYGLVIGFLYHKYKLNLYLSILITMLIGRIGAGLVVWILVYIFNLSYLPNNPLIFIYSAIITGLPGIGVQLILIPLLVKYLKNYFQKEQVLKYV